MTTDPPPPITARIKENAFKYLLEFREKDNKHAKPK